MTLKLLAQFHFKILFMRYKKQITLILCIVHFSCVILAQRNTQNDNTINNLFRKDANTPVSIETKKIDEISNLSLRDYIESKNFYYKATPEWPMFLGVGFDPSILESSKQSPFKFTVDTVEGKGSLSTSFNIDIVFNKQQLMNSLEIDAKLNLKFLTASVNASLNVVEKTEFSDENLVVVLKGQTEYGRLIIQNLELKQDASYLYKNCVPVITGNKRKKKETCNPIYTTETEAITAFQELYGTKLPVVQRRGAAIYLVMQIRNVSDVLKRKIQSSLSVTKNFMFASASLNVELKTELMQKMQRNEVNVSILTNGGNAFKGIDGIINSIKQENTSFEDVKNSFGEVLKQFDFSNAAPLGYFCVDYKILGLNKLPTPIENDVKKEKALGDVVYKYRKNENLIFLLNNIIDYNNPAGYILSTQKREELSLLQRALIEFQNELKIAHKKLLRQPDFYEVPAYPNLENYKLPEILDLLIVTEYKLRTGVPQPDNLNLNDNSIIEDFSYKITTPFLKQVSLRIVNLSTGATTLSTYIVPPRPALDRDNAFLPGQIVFSNNDLTIKKQFFEQRSNLFNPSTAFESGSITNNTTVVNSYKVYLTSENLFDVSRSVTIAYVLAYKEGSTFKTKFFYYPVK